MSERELEGRGIVVTGGASGMGAGLVRALVRAGAEVVSLDLAAQEGAAVATAAGARFLRCDVADEASVDEAVAAAAAHLGRLDVLVHAAGVAPGAPAAETELALWHRAMDVNATGTFLTNRAAFRHLRERGGRILNFASGAGVNGYPGKAAYAASKGAVLAWTRSVAVEWAPYGITVNAIAPAIRTPMYEATRRSMTGEQLAAHDAALAGRLPLGGQLGDIERDLVPVLVFLAGDGARFMTGQVFAVDGGMLMVR
jgi:NAD(P)-dependent dehydrogenase (short-subunit alcohol dehydrogenase family)